MEQYVPYTDTLAEDTKTIHREVQEYLRMPIGRRRENLIRLFLKYEDHWMIQNAALHIRNRNALNQQTEMFKGTLESLKAAQAEIDQLRGAINDQEGANQGITGESGVSREAE